MPILPEIIKIIIISSPIVLKSAQRLRESPSPIDIPTVLNADTTSNKSGKKGMFGSNIARKKVATW